MPAPQPKKNKPQQPQQQKQKQNGGNLNGKKLGKQQQQMKKMPKKVRAGGACSTLPTAEGVPWRGPHTNLSMRRREAPRHLCTLVSLFPVAHHPPPFVHPPHCPRPQPAAARAPAPSGGALPSVAENIRITIVNDSARPAAPAQPRPQPRPVLQLLRVGGGAKKQKPQQQQQRMGPKGQSKKAQGQQQQARRQFVTLVGKVRLSARWCKGQCGGGAGQRRRSCLQFSLVDHALPSPRSSHHPCHQPPRCFHVQNKAGRR